MKPAIPKTLYQNHNSNHGCQCLYGMATEEVKVWTAGLAQGVWMSTGAEQAKEIEVVMSGTAGLDLSGNT